MNKKEYKNFCKYYRASIKYHINKMERCSNIFMPTPMERRTYNLHYNMLKTYSQILFGNEDIKKLINIFK